MGKKTWTALVLKETLIPWTNYWNSYNVEVEDANPDSIKFNATLKYNSIVKGYGSGCSVSFIDVDRTYIDKKGEIHQLTYNVFITDVDKIINKLVNGICNGTFTVCKRGQDYGIKLVE